MRKCVRRHEVFGIFMRNWDEAEELGNQGCNVEADFKDAQRVCKHIGIPLHEADFVNEYWNQVFAPFLDKVPTIPPKCPPCPPLISPPANTFALQHSHPCSV